MNIISRIENLPTSVYLALSQIDTFNGRWIGGGTLSPQILNRLKKSALATSTGASTRIEGSDLSDEQVEDVMRGLALTKMKERDIQEVKGYYETLKLVFESYENIDFTEGSILQLHSSLLKYSTKDERHRGAYKHLENRVEMLDGEGKLIEVVFETTPAYLTPKEMQELVQETKILLASNETHQLLVISNFVVAFLKIHPFQDGNGRMSRILTNLLLLKSGYVYTPYVSQEKIIEDTRVDYYIALRRSQKTFGGKEESIAEWTSYFFKVLLAQAKAAVELVSNDNISLHLTKIQNEILNYVRSSETVAPREIAEATGITPITIAKSLIKLQKLKLVEMIGEGRSTRYRRI